MGILQWLFGSSKSTAGIQAGPLKPQRVLTAHDARKEPTVPPQYLLLKVETGLLGKLPRELKISSHTSPCAILAVVDTRSGEILWRVIKQYKQLNNFKNLIEEILDPLLRSGAVYLPYFPPSEWFLKTIPWQVDVRIDMMNAYFRAVSWLNDNAQYNETRSIKRRVENALSALSQHNLVDVRPEEICPSLGVPDMWGFLLSRSENHWVCKYCTTNGAYLDIQAACGSDTINKSISLESARVARLPPHIDGEDSSDDRYPFIIFWEREGSEVYKFSAESVQVCKAWVRALSTRASKVKSGGIDKGLRVYDASSIPVPYRLRESTTFSHSPSASAVSHLSSSRSLSSHRASHSRDSTGEPQKGSLSNGRPGRFASHNPLESHLGSLAEPQVFEGTFNEISISSPVAVDRALEISAQDELFGADSSASPQSLKYFDALRSQARGNWSDPKTDVSSDHYFGFSRDPSLGSAINIQKPGKLFGTMPQNCLNVVQRGSGRSLPTLVARCIDRLTEPGATSENGLFRKSGTQTTIDAVQAKFDEDGDYDLIAAEVDIHSTTDLLKRYLRSLPECLLGKWDEPKVKSMLSFDDDTRVQVLLVEMNELIPQNRAVVEELVAFLSQVSKNEVANSMGLRNLSVALSPALRVPAPVLAMHIKYSDKIM